MASSTLIIDGMPNSFPASTAAFGTKWNGWKIVKIKSKSLIFPISMAFFLILDWHRLAAILILVGEGVIVLIILIFEFIFVLNFVFIDEYLIYEYAD